MPLQESTASSLDRLLHPRSMALVGISTAGKFGGYLYANLQQLGFQGSVYGVNPRYDELYGQPVYPSLSDLPEVPDCAVLAISNKALLPIMEEAAALGVGAAVIFGSAYSEPQPGEPTLLEQLAQIARAHGMALCGPNGMGFMTLHQGAGAVGEPIPDLKPGGVTFISHSGSVYDALIQNTRGVRFNYAVSSGNEIVTTMADYVLFALQQPTTRAIALFMETVRDPQRLMAAFEMAASRDIPIVAIKIGRSERGARLAQAHSGAIAGEDAAYDALFRHYGVRRAKSLDDLTDTLELFQTGMRAPTRFISTIHDSGGERGLLVDLADEFGVAFTPISAETTAKLSGILEDGLEPVNPLDAWGTFNAFERVYRDSLLALDSDPLTGITLFACDLWPVADLSDAYVEIALAIQPHLKRPLAFLTNLAAATSAEQSARARGAGIPVLMGTENGLRAVRHLLEYSDFQRRRAAASETVRSTLDAGRVAEVRQIIERADGPLGEVASRAILAAYGIAGPAEEPVTSWEEAVRAAGRIGYPVALKTASGELHKSDRGGVHLNLRDAGEVEAAYAQLAAVFGPSVLVQQMIGGGTELILGMVHDAQFGPLLLMGLGGIFVEAWKDHRCVMLPASHDDLRAALLSLRGARLLDGLRGRPPASVEAIVDAAAGLAALIADLGDLIGEIDVNPLIALPDRAVAVDALIVPRRSPGD